MLLFPRSGDLWVITVVALFTFACHVFVFQCFIIQEYKKASERHECQGHIKSMLNRKAFGFFCYCRKTFILHWDAY